MPGTDKNGNEIGFGDEVHYFIPGHGGHAYVAGEMSYSEEGSHVLLVNENEIGMPIHAGHCQRLSRGHADKVRPWRDRYTEMFPKGLKLELTPKPGPPSELDPSTREVEETMKADVALVSCVKLKISHPAPAKDLYMRSPWFRGARRYAQEHAKSWFILSALHGLVDPETVIEPYEKSLNGADIDERHEWTMKVIRQIAEKDLFGDRVVVLAGLHYRQLLINPLILRFKQIDVPMEGLMMGQQLQWLSRRQAIES